MSGSASGSIDGVSVAFTFDGDITGVNCNGISMFFDCANANSAGGVAMAVD